MLSIECVDTDMFPPELSQATMGIVGSVFSQALPQVSANIALQFVDDEEIQRLNREYREKDSVTDVLSFAYHESGDGQDMGGDVLISTPQARRQAAEADNDVELELIDLIVHGILHILGYDHMEDEEAQEMFALQDEIVNKILSYAA